MCQALRNLPEEIVYPAVVYTTGNPKKPYEIDLRVGNPRGEFQEMLGMRKRVSKVFAAIGRGDDHKIYLVVEGDKYELSRIMRWLNNKPGSLLEEMNQARTKAA